MSTHCSINNNIVHLWRALLTDFITDEHNLIKVLSPDETERAERFRFVHHRQRFTIARGLLRKTLSFYTGIAPEEIIFSYGPHGKPYLQKNELQLQFNVSHSDEMAVYAITVNKEIGVDIERIKPIFKEGIAKRFFNKNEYIKLMKLPADKRINSFYQIWSKKEALIKALGEGLFASIHDIATSLEKEVEIISVNYHQHEYHYYVQNFFAHEDYQASFVTQVPVEKIVYWQWTSKGAVNITS